MQRIFHTPDGFRDIYQKEFREKRTLIENIGGVFAEYGYEEIQTPLIEYFEVFSSEVGTTPSRELYKFFDREGNTLVLRPDFTPSIARAAASYFLREEKVQRLCYSGSTFVNHSGLRGRLQENTQMGIELIGDAEAEADAEVISMAVSCLLRSGLQEFQISVGNADFFRFLVDESGMNEEQQNELRTLISQKNYFGVENFVNRLEISDELKETFLQLPQLFGSAEILEKARTLTKNENALKAIRRLQEIHRILTVYGCEKYVSYDLGMLSKYRYYTGIIFQGYTYGTGEPVVKGGRYDSLLEHFGKSAPAVGFGIAIDQLHVALNRQKIAIHTDRELTVLEYTAEDRDEKIRQAVALRREGRSVQLRRRNDRENGSGGEPA